MAIDIICCGSEDCKFSDTSVDVEWAYCEMCDTRFCTSCEFRGQHFFKEETCKDLYECECPTPEIHAAQVEWTKDKWICADCVGNGPKQAREERERVFEYLLKKAGFDEYEDAKKAMESKRLKQ